MDNVQEKIDSLEAKITSLQEELQKKITPIKEELKELYEQKYGGLSEQDFNVVKVMKELEQTIGFARNMRDERENNIPWSETSLFSKATGCVSEVIPVTIISDTDFKVDRKHFEDHTFSIEDFEHCVFKHKNREEYVLEFRTTYQHEQYGSHWSDYDLFMMSNNVKEIDYLDLIKKAKNFVETIRKG